MKIVKIGSTWYSAFDGNYVSSDTLNENVKTWNTLSPSDIAPSVMGSLEKEFGSFDSEASADKDAGGIEEISLEDATTVAKFDSWHITVTNSGA